MGLTALDGRTHHLAPALVAATPAFAARLLGLSVLGSGVVGATLAAAGVVPVLGAWGLLELTGLMPEATIWRGIPGGVRGEIAGATVLGALGGWALIIGGRATA